MIDPYNFTNIQTTSCWGKRSLNSLTRWRLQPASKLIAVSSFLFCSWSWDFCLPSPSQGRMESCYCVDLTSRKTLTMLSTWSNSGWPLQHLVLRQYYIGCVTGKPRTTEVRWWIKLTFRIIVALDSDIQIAIYSFRPEMSIFLLNSCAGEILSRSYCLTMKIPPQQQRVGAQRSFMGRPRNKHVRFICILNNDGCIEHTKFRQEVFLWM